MYLRDLQEIFRIFRRMRIKSIRHIILLFSFLSIGLFSSQCVQAETLISASKKVTLTQASPQLPDTKMEVIKQDVTSVCHNSMQKKIFVLASLSATTNNHYHIAEESFFIKRSLLLVKRYLLFNYPFHHFW